MKEDKQIRINLITNIANLVASVIIGLIYTPYLVRTLGVAAYGIVPLALIINQYINVIAGSLTGSLTRFYSIALQNDNKEEASSYLSTSFATISTIIIILTPFFILLIINIDSVFNIPFELVSNAKRLFTFTIISFVFSLFSAILNITLYSLNRLDLMNLIKILRISFKFLLTIFFLEKIEINIAYIGYANCISEIIILALSLNLFYKINQKEIKLSLRFFNKARLLSMLGMTTWVLIHQIGDTGLYGTDNILVNIFWNTKESGILGALSEFGGYVMLIVSVISSLFGPLILIAYSKKEQDKVLYLTLNNSLIVGILTAILTGVLIGFAKPIIGFWLGTAFVPYSNWFIIKLITIPTYAAAGIFAFTYRACNKVRFPALVTIIIGITNFAISYILYTFYKHNETIITKVLSISALLVIIQSYGLNAFWFSYIYRGNGLKVMRIFLKIVLVLIITTLISYSFESYYGTKTIVDLLLKLSLSGIICSIMTFFFALNKDQKKSVLSLINYQIKK